MSDFSEMLEQLIEQRLAPIRAELAQLKAAANQGPTAPVFVSLKRAEELYGQSVARLRKWIDEGELPAFKEKREYVVACADVERLVRSRQAPAQTKKPAPVRPSLKEEVELRVARLPRRAAR
jgi:hypothetical protein